MKATIITTLIVLLIEICHHALSTPCACAKREVDVIAAGNDDSFDYIKLVTLYEGQCLLQDLDDQDFNTRIPVWISVKYKGIVSSSYFIFRVPHAEQEMLTLPENLVSPLVFIEVHVVLSFVSPYFML